jgi:hypothetical protein
VIENIRLVKQSMGQGETTTETDLYRCKSSPVTGLEWPRGFQEVKVPRFQLYRCTNEKTHAYRKETSNSEE